MKKILLSVSILVAMGANAQDILQQDNFDALTVGDVGTDLTGMTAGQGGYYTGIAADGANSDFQIVADDADHANVLQITGSPTATNSRVLWKDGLADAWAARTSGNDIIEFEFDLFTGPATTSKNAQRVVIYDATGTAALAGLSFAEDTKIISGVAYYNNAGTVGNYLFTLGAAPVVLPENTWVHMGMSFNYNTGDVIWRSEGTYFNGYITGDDGTSGGAGAFTDPFEVDFVMSAGTGNTVAAVGKYDNYVVRASPEDLLLGTHQAVADNDFAIYPNPASSVINVTNPKNVNAVSITDLNGRIVKQQKFGNVTEAQVNISDLANGVYMMTVSSDSGSIVKKIVKQ
jgi:hypothetical protein